MLTPEELERIIRALAPLIRGEELPHLLARQLEVKTSVIGVTSGATQKVVSANPNRVHLILASVSSVVGWVLPLNAPSTLSGIPLGQNLPPIILSAAADGVLPQLEWDGTSGGASTQITVVETVWRPPGG